MKIIYASLLTVFTMCTLTSMDRTEYNYQWFTELADVPMGALLVPARQQATPQPSQNPPAPTPGLLQVVHDTINNRPGNTN